MIFLMTQGHLPSCWSIEILLKEQITNGKRQLSFDFFKIKNFKVQIRIKLPPKLSLKNNPERAFFISAFIWNYW